MYSKVISVDVASDRVITDSIRRRATIASYRGKRLSKKKTLKARLQEFVLAHKLFLTCCAVSMVLGIVLTSIITSSIISNLRAENKELLATQTEHLNRIEELESGIKEVNDFNTTLQNTVNETSTMYNDLYEEYTNYQELIGYSGETLYNIANKYMYVITATPEESKLTLDNLVTMDELAKEANINPHIIAKLFYHESRYNSNAKNSRSSATGLGQFLGSTGKFVYNKLLGHTDTYNHSVDARNPELNIEMTVAYIKYLRDYNNGDLRRALLSYNGESGSYADTVFNMVKRELGTNTISYNYM